MELILLTGLQHEDKGGGTSHDEALAQRYRNSAHRLTVLRSRQTRDKCLGRVPDCIYTCEEADPPDPPCCDVPFAPGPAACAAARHGYDPSRDCCIWGMPAVFGISLGELGARLSRCVRLPSRQGRKRLQRLLARIEGAASRQARIMSFVRPGWSVEQPEQGHERTQRRVASSAC